MVCFVISMQGKNQRNLYRSLDHLIHVVLFGDKNGYYSAFPKTKGPGKLWMIIYHLRSLFF